jgi:hypothetical protein
VPLDLSKPPAQLGPNTGLYDVNINVHILSNDIARYIFYFPHQRQVESSSFSGSSVDAGFWPCDAGALSALL